MAHRHLPAGNSSPSPPNGRLGGVPGRRLSARVQAVDPAVAFPGTVLVLAPHMDDEVLACGGTLALIPHKERIHLVYASDGARSPAPALGWLGSPGPEIPRVRRVEAERAATVLGVPAANLQFLDLPDGALRRFPERLCRLLAELLAELRPAHLFIPFRYDRHRDHLALHRAALAAVRRVESRPEIFEYFVYYRWRLLASGDVRTYIRPESLVRVEIQETGRRKMAALRCHESQTTCFYPWQERPVLTGRALEEVCAGPEVFVRADGSGRGPAVFSSRRWWIPLAHRAEPVLKRIKDGVVALLGWGRPGAGSARG